MDTEERELRVLVARQNLKRACAEHERAESEERERIRRAEEDRLARAEEDARKRTHAEEEHQRSPSCVQLCGAMQAAFGSPNLA